MVTRKRSTPLKRKTPTRKPPVKTRVRRNEAKKNDATPSKDVSAKRIIGVGIFFTLIFLVLGYRAFTLQIIRGPELAEAARRQYITTEYVAGTRGNITDRNGNILARSVDSSSVWMNPGLIKEKERAAIELSSILGIPQKKMDSLLSQNRKFIWLSRKVDNTIATQIKEAKIYGVYIDHEDKRVYPYKTLVGQLLGFVDADGKGLEGIEKGLDNVLSGERVRQVVQRDAAGRRMMIRGTADTSDLRGQDVRLTIDANVQFFAEEALAEHVEQYSAKWGGCLVIDVSTGEILAWAQSPSFDPNAYGQYPPEIRRNRIAMDALEQGSTIKSFLVAAALEEKAVTPDTMINCENGRWKIGKEVIHDTHPYAELPVRSVLHVSSNIGAAKMGLMLGRTKYYNYLSSLGFGSRTDLPLPGQSKGILRKGSTWGEVDLASASFGQGFSATLLQMGQAYLTLAHDGVKIPIKLVIDKKEEATSGVLKNTPKQRLFSQESMKELRAMLRLVVEEDGGTGKRARIPGMEVGGKTGTAQKADKSGKYGAGRVGSFVGMVPIENPRYLICVLLDEPAKSQYGGVNSAPVFRSVALNTMAYHGLLPDSDDPLVRQIAEKQAERKRKKGSLVPNNNSVAQLEISPIDVGNSSTEEKLPVYAQDTVPTVVGMSLQKAVEIIASQGRVPNIVGTGAFVVSQSPKGGSKWGADNSFTIWLQEGRRK